MKRLFGIVLTCLLSLFFVVLYYYNRWKPLWSLEEPRTTFSITHYHDDTLRIVMIGDSWVEMRTDSLNNLFQESLSSMIHKPIIVKTKGKGGEKSRGIYQLMFEEDSFGTKPLFMSGTDYCAVFAGINDAAANLGKKQFVHHMNLIVSFLLANHIRPVLIEIPDVNIWTIYGGKPFKDFMADYIRSLMTQCGIYNYSEYREALYSMLNDNNLTDSVLYVPMKGWNGEGPSPNRKLFLDDQIHINKQGYIKLDSCIMEIIKKDLKYF